MASTAVQKPAPIKSTDPGRIQRFLWAFEESDLPRIDGGMIGFPEETRFVLVPHGASRLVAWLQSVETPALAFPVVSAHALVAEYPDVPVEDAARSAGIGGGRDDLAVLAVLSAQVGAPGTVNLLAPILVNSSTRVGAQVFLEGSRFTTRELFMLPAEPTAAGGPAPAEGAPAP